MSKNRKHRVEPAYLRPKTNDVIQRSIVIEDRVAASHFNHDQGLRQITELLNSFIQTLNFMVPRNIPYVSLSASEKFKNDPRVFIRTNPDVDINGVLIPLEDSTYLTITHLIDMFIDEGDFALDEPISPSFSIEVILNSMYTRMMIIDIFLDIAFFNSYSFLKNASVDEKRKFSIKKYEFYKKQGYTSCFDKVADRLNYYSFAFSCHKNVKEGNVAFTGDIDKDELFDLDFDFDEYVKIWSDFISTNYPSEKHIEKTIEDQIKLHVDNKQISPYFFTEFTDYCPGIHFFIRLDSIGENISEQKWLSSIFRGSKLTIGLTKIVTMEQLEQYEILIRNQVVSAFKIVITEENRLRSHSTV